MKILFINSVVDYGSTGKIVKDLSNGLTEQGHEVMIAYGRHSASNEEGTFSIVDKFSTMRHVFMSRFFGRHGMHSTAATKKLINFIDDFQPNIINLHNLHGYYLNVPLLLKYLQSYKGKILWTLHDTWLISGSSAYFDFNGCNEWDEGCVVCNSTKDYPRADFIKRQRKNFQWKKDLLFELDNLSFITPSIWLKDLLSKTFLKDVPCFVINNGIDTSVFKENHSIELETKYADKKILLGVANKWEERKGLDDFIKLNSKLSDEYQIILVGLSDKQVVKLPEGIVGITRTESALELTQYYSSALAFINPTYEDNYPTTNLEALSCNTAVIAYDTGGNKEVEGIEIVEQGDVDGIIEKLNTIDPNRSYSNNYFSKERFIDEMLELFNTVD